MNAATLASILLTIAVLSQVVVVIKLYKPLSRLPGFTYPSRKNQNIWYSANLITMSIPVILTIYLHIEYEFLEWSDIGLLSSLLMLFLAGFYPVTFVRVFKPAISKIDDIPTGFIDNSEQRANLWAEIFLGLGSLTAVIATLNVGYNAEMSRLTPLASTSCLGRLRDYVAPPLHPLSANLMGSSAESQQIEIRKACANMR